MGKSFASRMAASLLNAIDLPELITTSAQQYEDKAIELAENPVKLNEIKNKLIHNKIKSDLFNTAKFTIYLENAYSKIYEENYK
jgi:predicted O-linked N-acetylglucosamine transferase (SPINDLY family)